jgi:hypothetical protein
LLHTSLYIGPGLGIGAGILIVLILLLIIFSFGYRLWFVFAGQSAPDTTGDSKEAKNPFGLDFYLALLLSFAILLFSNPNELVGQAQTYANNRVTAFPIWVTILIGLMIIGSLYYSINNAKDKSLKQRLRNYSFSPLHLVLVSVICLVTMSSRLAAWIEPHLSIPYLSHILIVLSGIVLGLGILWLKPLFFKLAKSSLGLLNQLLAENKDSKKLQALNTASNQTIRFLAVNTFWLSVIILAVYWLIVEVIGATNPESVGLNWTMILLSVGATLPFLKTSSNNSGYSDINQLFHHLFLDHYHIGKALLKRQIKGVEHPVESGAVSAVLVTGLARAGTTALTRTLSERGPFRSLDYSNMPVLLAPRLWGKFYRPSRKEQQERAHGDGIKVGLASVEALEEYFFKVVTGDRFVKKDRLLRHELSEEENVQYRRYYKSLCKPGEVYLAKNNNAVLRLPSLLAQNPDMKVFVLVREPLEHAYSLYKQHLKFSKEQAEDPFVLTYMNWLGHHEFGQGQLPFDLGALGDERDREKLDFWLERWVEYYSYAQGLGGVEFIRYEEFLAHPSQVVERIAKATGMTINAEDIPVFEKTPEVPSGFSPELASMAQKVYEGLE